MEINIKNAFLIAVRATFEPCRPIYNTITESVQNRARDITYTLLERPALSISILLIVTITFAAALIIPFLLYFVIVCFMVGVIMIEGVITIIIFFILLTGTIIIILIIMIKVNFVY